MRIYIFSTEENIFHPKMFYEILKEHSTLIVGAAIFPSKETLYDNIKKCLKIDGLKAIPRCAKYRFTLQKERISKLPQNCYSVRNVFKYFGIHIDYFDSPNDNKCIERLKNLSISVVFNNQPIILKRDILSMPGVVFLNRHTSKLPEYRGVDPVFYALLDGKRELGVTIHKMTSDIDAGEIYAQVTFTASKSVYDCYSGAFNLSSKLFSQAIENLSKNVSLLSVDSHNTKYYKLPRKDDILKFRKLGLTYI